MLLLWDVRGGSHAVQIPPLLDSHQNRLCDFFSIVCLYILVSKSK